MENWKEIKDYESSYQVSDWGRIRSRNGKILMPFKSNGYLAVKLCLSGETENFKVHRLVCTAFLPNPESKPEINHKNGNKLDNRLVNLEWVTRQENIDHAWQSGLKIGKSGADNGNAKLSESDVLKIRGMASGGTGQREIARQYGVDVGTVNNIVHRKTWKNV